MFMDTSTSNMQSLLISNREQWNPATDACVLFEELYSYYDEGGFLQILLQSALNVMTTVITSALLFAVAALNFDKILQCEDRTTCEDATILHSWFIISTWHVILGFCVCIPYCTFTAWRAMHTCIRAYASSLFFKHKLDIRDEILHLLSWKEIVQRLKDVHTRTPLTIGNQPFDAHDIANVIMRKYNFLIALDSTELLPDCLLVPCNLWIVQACITNNLFTVDNRFNKRFFESQTALNVYVLTVGVAVSLLLGFIISFGICDFAIRHARELRVKDTPRSLFERNVDDKAHVKRRCFNELPHEFRDRINKLLPIANQYLDCYPAPYFQFVVKLIRFWVGMLTVFLLICSCINETILLHMRVPDNGPYLIIWLAILTFSLSALRLPYASNQSPANIHESGLKLAVFLDDPNAINVYAKTQKAFPMRYVSYIWQVYHTLQLPYALLVQMPRRTPLIRAFLLNSYCTMERVGDICLYANLIPNLTPHPVSQSIFNSDIQPNNASVYRKTQSSTLLFEQHGYQTLLDASSTF